MNIDALRAALQPLTEFGQEEYTFEVEGTKVTLRPLLPREEVACQQASVSALAEIQEEEGLGDDDPLSRAAALSYMDRFRTEVISYALVEVNGVNFRKVEYIETGEKTDQGVAVKVKKQVALRNIILESWSRGMITITFSKYGDLIQEVSRKADKVAKESLEDLDAEIERTEKYLESLKKDRESRAKGDPSVTAKQIEALVNAGKALEQDVDAAIDTVRNEASVQRGTRQRDQGPTPEPEPPAPEPEPRAAAPAPEPPPRAPETPRETSTRPARTPVTPEAAPPPTRVPEPPEMRSSFEEAGSVDSDAIEEDRIRAARAAAEMASNSDLGAGDLSQAQAIGTVKTGDGKDIPAFRLQRETISERGTQRGDTEEAKKKLDPDPHRGTRNPNFKPPGR